MDVEIVVPEQPDEADRAAILTPLVAFNDAKGGASLYRTVAILLRDKTTGETTGGLWGKIAYSWFFAELLFVPEQLRGSGTGSRLLARAEDIARANGCAGIWLDTFSFQAPGFYRKLGYEVFGTLEDHPAGARRFFFRKRF